MLTVMILTDFFHPLSSGSSIMSSLNVQACVHWDDLTPAPTLSPRAGKKFEQNQEWMFYIVLTFQVTAIWTHFGQSKYHLRLHWYIFTN